MIIKLDSTEHEAIHDLAGSFDNHQAVIEAVISGSEPGCIFADRRSQPTCFFLHEYDGFFFLHGSPSEEFLRGIAHYLFDELQAKCIEIIISDPSLEKAIPLLFGNRTYKVMQRMTLDFDRDTYDRGTSPLPLSSKAAMQVTNTEKTLQVVLKNDKDTICECRAIIGTKQFEISINTVEKYRRKGYATLAVSEIINQGLKRDLMPMWSCWSFNKASLNLAHKLGFTESEEVAVYLWDIYI